MKKNTAKSPSATKTVAISQALTYAERIRLSQSEITEKVLASQEKSNLSLLLNSLEKTDSDLSDAVVRLDKMKSASRLDLAAITNEQDNIKGYEAGKEGLKSLLNELFPNWQDDLINRYKSI